jgi:nucleoside phosphorylase
LDVRGLTPECKIGQISPETEYIYKLETNLVDGLPIGKCISGDIFVSNRADLQEIINEYSPDVVEMELTAIAMTMKTNNIAEGFYSLKVVSDKANEDAGVDFGTMEDRMFGKVREIVATL